MDFKSTGSDELKQQATQLIDEQQFSSIEWQLTHKENVLSRGSVAVDPSTLNIKAPIYRIYSMTKPIVSLIALQLIDKNRLQLQDNISQFIPAMQSLKVLDANGKLETLQRPISVEHLLTHTAGFSYDFLPDCPVAQHYRDVQLCERGDRSLAEFIGLLTAMPLCAQPGTQWRYSVSIDVLAHVLENVTEKALPELMSEYVFGPLEMHDTAFHVPSEKVERLLPMFGARELGQVMLDSDEPNVLNAMDIEASYPYKANSGFYRGGHGLFSTLDDYQKFMHALQYGTSPEGQPIIGQDALDTLWTHRIDDALMPLVLGFNTLNGYGWNLMGRVAQDYTQCEFNTAPGEGGWAGAASTYFWIDRDNDISGIAMSQYLGSTTHLGELMQHTAYDMFAD